MRIINPKLTKKQIAKMRFAGSTIKRYRNDISMVGLYIGIRTKNFQAPSVTSSHVKAGKCDNKVFSGEE